MYVVNPVPSRGSGVEFVAVARPNNSKVVEVGFFTVWLAFKSVIPATLAIVIVCPSVKLCPPEQVTTTGSAVVAPVIVADPAFERLSIIPVAPEVPPVSLSPVVRAPDIAPATLTWLNISMSKRKCLNFTSVVASLDKRVVAPESVLTALPELYSNALVFARPISNIPWTSVANTVPLEACASSTSLKVL